MKLAVVYVLVDAAFPKLVKSGKRFSPCLDSSAGSDAGNLKLW